MSGREPNGPPRLLRALARRILRGPHAEFVLADLDEDWGEQRSRRSAPVCSWRYLRLAVTSSWVLRRPDSRAGGLLYALTADTRYAVRSLRSSPGFAAVAALTLALGIGATTAIFTVVHGVLLAPLPYAEPDRLVNVWQVFHEWQDSEVEVFRQRAERFPASWPVYQEWARRSRSFEAIAVYGNYPTIVDGDGLAGWVNVVSTTRSFADVVGVRPALGRWFDADEDRVGGARVVVISHRYWRDRLGSDPGALGATLRIHGDPFVVIGVMPEAFYFPDRSYDMWYPVPDGRRNDRFTSQSMATVARLRPGVSIAAAQSEMDGIADQIMSDHPDAIDAGVRLVSRVDEVAGDTSGTLGMLAAAVGLVLLVAASNVAGLLLVRNAARAHELAIRAALGARRARLTLQLILEGTLVAALGGIGALLAVGLALGWMRAQLPPGTPRVEDVALGGPVIGFVAAVSAGVGLMLGLISAARLGKGAGAVGLRSGGREVGVLRGRAALVIGEIAVSVALLAGAVMLATSYYRLASVESGFHNDGLLTVAVAAPIDLWHDAPEELRAFFVEASARLEVLPGVSGAAVVSSLPFTGSQSSAGFGFIENPQSEEETGWSLVQTVSPSYFEVMGIPMRAGESFGVEVDGPAELVVNEQFAARFFPDGSPIGETVWESDDGPHVIVGVVGNVRHNALTETIEAKRYRLFDRHVQAAPSYVLRVDGDPEAVASAARAALVDIRPGVTVDSIASLTELIDRTTALPRFRTLLMVALALVATLLSAIGLYGVVAFAVAARRREFGLRMTLGAGGRDVVRLVLVDGIRLTVPGVVIGAVAALAAGGWLTDYLYRVDPRDPIILVWVAAAVVLLALSAMLPPAWRALRVDPMVALRND